MMRKCTLLPLLVLSVGACDQGPTSPLLQATVAGLFERGRVLQVGEVLTLTGGETQAVFLRGGENGAEYLYVPFNATENATARLTVEVRGGNVVPPTDLTSPARAPAPSPVRLSAFGGAPQPDWAFHEGLREREIRELAPRVRRGGGAPARRSAASLQAAPLPAEPRVGDLLELNANPRDACNTPLPRTGRVAAVTDRAIVVEDVANPAGGFTADEFRRVGMVFDTLIFPVDVFNFGPPVFAEFIRPRDRVIIFYTRVVNELTEPGSGSFVGGFFFGRDLFPRQATDRFEACATSNEAPILYLLAPDPQGVAGDVRTKDFILRVTLSTVAHELQHLINQSRRLFSTVGAAPFEEVWLNEGLSHIAEELQFYAATRLEPRQNIDIETLRSSEQILEAFRTYQSSNFGRYRTYLENPDTASLLGIDDLPTRGASWAFLRYAADQENGPDHLFFRKLVDGRESGVRNLANALPVNPIDLMQTWTASNFTDDVLPRVPFEVIYQQPSWNFRSIYRAIVSEYPLQVRALTGEERVFTLRGGGAAFLRFAIPAGGQAAIVTTTGGNIPEERLRVSIARLR
jgi:hypothetical protein